MALEQAWAKCHPTLSTARACSPVADDSGLRSEMEIGEIGMEIRDGDRRSAWRSETSPGANIRQTRQGKRGNESHT